MRDQVERASASRQHRRPIGGFRDTLRQAVRRLIGTRSDAQARSVWTPMPTLGIALHSREWRAGAGDEPPIVLVAGLGVSSRYWVPLADRMAGRHAVYAPDLPGFGRSPPAAGTPWPAGPAVRTQADQLRAWLVARGLAGRDDLVLIGHSVGCQIVADLVAREPKLARRVVLAGPTFERGARNMPRQFLRLVRASLFEAPALIPVLAIEYGGAGLPRVLQQAWRAIGDPIEAKLPRLTMPTLVLRGEHDLTISARWTEAVAATLPDASLVTIERVGHAIQFSSSRAMAETVERFLDGTLDERRDEGPRGEIIAPWRARADRPMASPPQPISTRAHLAIGIAAGIAAIALSGRITCGPRTRRTLAVATALGALTTIASDFGPPTERSRATDDAGGRRKRIPMVTHLTLDLTSGTALVALAATSLRGEPRAGRLLCGALGLVQACGALLTYAPTGPARRGART